MPNYDRPVKATLYVHLENGESWVAKPDDLEKFNLVDRHRAYMIFDERLGEILAQAGLIRRDVTDAQLNPVRYLVETAVVNPDLIDHPEHKGWEDVTELERRLVHYPQLYDAVSRLADRWDSSKQMRIDLTDRFGPIAQLIIDLVARVGGSESDPAEGGSDA